MSRDAEYFQERMVTLIRSFGLHQPDRTPCGEPVPISEAHALMELARAPDITLTTLAIRLRLDRSTVTRLMQHLVARGWVGRRRDPDDGRAALLLLTPTGREAAAQLARARAAKFTGIIAGIPATERAVVLEALDVLVRALDKGWKDNTTSTIPPIRNAAAGTDTE